jgi:hypothetical protein
MKILACFIKQSRFLFPALAALQAHKLRGSMFHFSLYKNICLFYKTSSLACNCFRFLGVSGVRIAQQKPVVTRVARFFLVQHTKNGEKYTK